MTIVFDVQSYSVYICIDSGRVTIQNNFRICTISDVIRSLKKSLLLETSFVIEVRRKHIVKVALKEAAKAKFDAKKLIKA